MTNIKIPLKCNYCDKTFIQSSNRKMHERIHTGEKPYKCSYCDKMFYENSTCTVHERTHTGEKPFKCKHCDKAFSQSCNCKTHERMHTGEKPFKCYFTIHTSIRLVQNTKGSCQPNRSVQTPRSNYPSIRSINRSNRGVI